MKISSKIRTIENSDKKVGILLCADYCAEHEWGIEELSNTLGILNPNVDDKSSFRITASDYIESVTVTVRGKEYFIITMAYSRRPRNTDYVSVVDWFEEEYEFWNEDGIVSTMGAWSKSDCRLVFTGDDIAFGKELFKAMKECRATVGLMGFEPTNNPYVRNYGLAIEII